jgi:hypothetical protein
MKPAMHYNLESDWFGANTAAEYANTKLAKNGRVALNLNNIHFLIINKAISTIGFKNKKLRISRLPVIPH